jgi:iron transport multicopper oxidase
LHYHFRASYVAADVESLVEQITNEPVPPCLSTNIHEKRQIAFTFIGQGSQSVREVARRLLDEFPTFHKLLVRSDDLTRSFGFPSFLDYINEYDCHESETQSASPIVEQLCLVAFQIAMAEMWMSWGVRPTVLLGHSLGEYSALCIAGVLSVSDTLFLVGKRAQLMEEICTEGAYGMLMVNLSFVSAQKLCSSPTCEISCMNGPSSTVISGSKAQIQGLQSKLDSEGIRAEQLSLAYAFHSAQMDPVLEPFASVVKSIPLAKPRMPILSSLLGRMLPEDTDIIPEYLVRHIREPVNFVGAMENGAGQVEQNGSASWLECGPGPGCLSMIRSCKKTSSSNLLPNVKKGVDGWKSISETLLCLYRQGHDIFWPAIQRDGESKAQLLELPNYAFQNQRHWIDHVKNDQRPSPTAASKIPFLSTCVQYLQPQTAESEDVLTRTFISDAKDPQLLAAIEGHRVHGQGLCPSSVYVDMAITSMKYVLTDSAERDVDFIIGVEDVEIFHPLIVSGTGPETKVIIETTPITSSKTVTVMVKSEQGTGTSATHSTCHIHLLDTKKQMSQWNRFFGFVSTTIEQLKDLTQRPGICHMPGNLVYRMFADIVDYDTKYHSIRQIFLDCERNEAYGMIQLPGPEEHGQFTCSPYCIDGIIHFAGFILNNSLSRPEDTAYISTGWESLRLIPSRLQAKTYKIYACMREEEKSRLWVGDVYLLDGDEIIATCFQLRFRQMNMAVLRSLVNPLDHQGISRPSNYQHGSKKVRPQTTSSPLSSNCLASVSAIIANELTIDVSAIKEHTLMEEMGVDSILAASISSSVQDTIGITLPMSLFAGKSSLDHISSYLRQHEATPPTTSNGSSPLFTPSSTPSTRSTHSSQGASLFNDFLTVLASQTGILLADMQPHTRFEDLGVDSLLSIAVLSMFQEVTGKSLPTSVFQNNSTIESMRTLLSGSDVAWTHQATFKSEPAPESTASASPQTYSHFASLLQGDQDSALPPLFLIAPGSGYPGSYMNLPKLRSKLPVYTMESPFLQRVPPEGWTMEDAASLYIKEIRRVRPRGPYLLGGWSIGGIYAYEIARQLLLTEQDDVLCIVMIDSPCPAPIPDMPMPTLEAVELTGLYAPIKRKGLPDIDMPLQLKEHTVGSLKALRIYDPRSLESNRRPRLVVQIWASMGQYDKLPERLREASELLAAQKAGTLSKDCVLGEAVGREWQTDPRHSFGPCGWDRLTGAVECHIVTGDHESIMSPPQVCRMNHLKEYYRVANGLHWTCR